MTEQGYVSHYQMLKIELDTVENDLKTHKTMPYSLYSHLKEKQRLLQEKIKECPLLYEIWYDSYDGSMRMNNSHKSLEERYLDCDKANKRLKELNDGCNYGKPYFLKVVELNG